MRLHLHSHLRTYNTCKYEDAQGQCHAYHLYTYNFRAQRLTTRDPLAFVNIIQLLLHTGKESGGASGFWYYSMQ